MNNKSIGNIFKGDKVIWMVFFFLCMISIVEVYSASSSLSYKTGNYMAPVIRHILLLRYLMNFSPNQAEITNDKISASRARNEM